VVIARWSAGEQRRARTVTGAWLLYLFAARAALVAARAALDKHRIEPRWSSDFAI